MIVRRGSLLNESRNRWRQAPVIERTQSRTNLGGPTASSPIKLHKTAVFLFVIAVVMFASSSGAAAQSDEPEKPARPVNVRVIAQGDGSVTVAWDVPGGRPKAEGYRVQYRLAAPESGSQPVETHWWYRNTSTVGPDSRQDRVRDLSNGVWYEIKVVAMYGDDEGRWSDDSVLARPGEGAPEVRPPHVPAEANVIAEEPGSVTITWDPPADDGGSAVTGYEVWHIRAQDRRQGTAEDAKKVVWTLEAKALSADVRTHVISGLVDYVQYYVIVAAVNDAGRGLFASVWGTANRDDLDPLGLIADHRFARAYSLGTDTWEVWICELPRRGNVEIDLSAALALLNREIPPYFSWLSGGKYQPEFVGGATVKAARSPNSLDDIYAPCHEVVDTTSAGNADAGLIIINWNCHDSCPPSSGSPGSRSLVVVDGVVQLDLESFPQNHRSVQTQPYSVLSYGVLQLNTDNPDFVSISTVAHEMGHTLGWPHSFGGQIFLGSSRDPAYADQYDNPMDILSGAPAD